VETIARQIEITGRLRFVQMSQHVADAAELVAADFAAVSVLVEPLQAPVTEAPDHKENVTRNVARCKT
jgi:hypothetical protein